MKNFLLHLLLIYFLLNPILSHAQYDSEGAPVSTTSSALTPEIKAFLIICGYGTVGGALLGLASMAFGGDARNMAKGASIGLYAGILFGAYVIYGHDNGQGAPAANDEYSNYGHYQWQEIPQSEFLISQSERSLTDFYIPVLDYRF